MKFRLVLVAFLISCMLCMSLAFAGKAPVHAQPDSVDCITVPCFSYQTWPGNTLAGLTTVYVPNFTGSSTNVIVRSIELDSNIGGDTVVVGYCFGSNFTIVIVTCNANSGEYFYFDVNQNFAASFPITPADKGYSVEIGASSNGIGGINFWIHNTHSGVNRCAPCQYGSVNTNWNSIVLEDEVEASWSGTHQGPFTWTNNQWGNSSGFQDQATIGKGVVAGDPPQARWTSPPAGESNEGGTLTMCEKDYSQTSC